MKPARAEGRVPAWGECLELAKDWRTLFLVYQAERFWLRVQVQGLEGAKIGACLCARPPVRAGNALVRRQKRPALATRQTFLTSGQPSRHSFLLLLAPLLTGQVPSGLEYKSAARLNPLVKSHECKSAARLNSLVKSHECKSELGHSCYWCLERLPAWRTWMLSLSLSPPPPERA